MRSRTVTVDCSTQTVEPGTTVNSTCSTLTSIGPIYVSGDCNTINTNNSEIRGNCNTINGNNNVVYGDSNSAKGMGNQVFGSFNSSTVVSVTRTQKVPNYYNTSPKDKFASIVSAGSGITVHSGGSVNIHAIASGNGFNNHNISFINNVSNVGNRAPKIEKKEEEQQQPKYPTKEERKHDQKAPEGDNDNTCIICLENKKNCVIRPCKHFCLCITCSSEDKALDLCPVCRVPVTCIERLF